MSEPPLPRIVQGGMGAGVSGWRLANAVARTGQLGVVSGTAMDAVLSRVLQDGDPGGHYRRALAAFPSPAMAQRVLDKPFIEGGKPAGAPYKPIPKLSLDLAPPPPELGAAQVADIGLAAGHRTVGVGEHGFQRGPLPGAQGQSRLPMRRSSRWRSGRRRAADHAPAVRHGHDAHPQAQAPRREQRGGARRPRPGHGDPAAVRHQALASRRGPREGQVNIVARRRLADPGLETRPVDTVDGRRTAAATQVPQGPPRGNQRNKEKT